MVEEIFIYIFLKDSEYFFRCCKEAKRIFYDYAKKYVEEL